MKTLDLSGIWNYKTDSADEGILKEFYMQNFTEPGFILPGSACSNGVGKKQEYYSEFSKEAVRAPRERFEYIAPLWLQREVEISEADAQKCIYLFLERVNIASDLWVDGKKIDRQIIELSAPHVYNLTGRLTAGKHILTLRIDNRNLLNLDIMASGYSIDTQGCWNGIIGKIELRFAEDIRLDDVQVYTDDKGIDVKTVGICKVYSPEVRAYADITLNLTAPDGSVLGEKTFKRTMFNSKQVDYFRYDMDNIMFWDEFNPNLYTLNVKYECDGVLTEKTVRFGMRTIKSENKKLMLNGRQLSLRGTTDCAQYPITGYPPMDKETWIKNFKTVQEYGLNHVRFHAWCPPEAAFDAADELGVYLSVEMPLWLNRDVCALELGEDPIHADYFIREAEVISKVYGNHPSFIMFSNGNENMGDFELLERITINTKAYDNRRIYTITSNFDHPVLPCEDYLCAFESYGNRVRIQTMHDEVAKSTCVSYDKAVEDTPVPIVSFEVGQYCAYPNVDICEKYTGNMMPVNFDVIKKEMFKKGVYHRLNEYIEASGDMAVKLYKEDIEAAMRTKNFGGFELLSLIDYTGQSTATVGILDVFYDSKGFISAEGWREFCNECVPLFKAKRVFKNTETLNAELDLYDFTENKIEKLVFNVSIYNGDELFWGTATCEREIEVPLGSIEKSAMLKVVVEVNGYKNSWRVYVYADVDSGRDIKIIDSESELNEVIKNGGRAIVSGKLFKNPIGGSFVPVFWSPVHFPTPKPCGAIIDEAHPLFKYFPTEKYPDYQWKTLLEDSVGANISKLESFKPMVEIVPNFVDNIPSSPLFEAKIGNAELLFCGLNLDDGEDVAAAAFKNAMISYVNSDEFKPQNIVSTDEI